MTQTHSWISLVLGLNLVLTVHAFAGSSTDATDDMRVSVDGDSANSRYGLFGGLDRRSVYNQEFFPQPLVVDDTGLEADGEFEINSQHMRAGARHDDMVTAEVQKSFGMLTLELGVPYQRESDSDDVARGIGNITVDARYPLYQFVSPHAFFDDTFGIAMEAGIPVHSQVSANGELDPKVFNDLKLGTHFSLQSVFGYATLLGPGDDGGAQSFEYGFAFAYGFAHKDLPLPGVEAFTPMFELVGETGLNKDEAGQNSLLGSAGFRLAFQSIGDLHPSLGVSYLFPIDQGAEAEFHWGIATSLTFEF